MWSSEKERNEETFHIDYDGEYGSERVLIVSGRATVVPDDGSPSFTVGTGDVVYFMHGFRCTWRILESPLVQRYGYFGADGKELKDDTLTCDVCSSATLPAPFPTLLLLLLTAAAARTPRGTLRGSLRARHSCLRTAVATQLSDESVVVLGGVDQIAVIKLHLVGRG